MRIPLISLPLKSGEQVDFSDDVYKCIEMYYEQDPMAYSLDVTKLNSTREKIIKNNNGDKELVENIALYLSYIESFEKRFKPDVCKIEFIWNDSFTERSVSQTSLSFEKASILYNFAASHSKLGAQQDRFELTGLKQAFSYYLASSSLLKHIRTTFINPPTDDLQSGVLTFLEEVMLCQAQEILIEKSRDENKSDQLVARLASHCHEVYYKLECESKETFQTDMKQIREILILVKCKALYYSALASYHQSLASKTLNMYPEIISYLKVATDDCERCKKEAKNFETASSSFWQKLGFEGGVDDTSPGRNLMLLIDNLQSAIKVANAQAIKDNDMIYNAQLIPRQSLKIDKVQAVQQSSLKNVLDAFGRPTTDLFANLISMTTHVQASLYSDKLDAMVRNYKDQVLHADTELENAITGQDLENFVTNAKMALVSNIESAHVMPDSLLTAVFELRQIEVQNDSSHRIERLQTLIDQFKTSCKNFEVSLIGEEVQNTKNQSQFLDRWTLPSSARANYNIKERLGQLSAEVAHFEFMVKELREKQVSLVPWIKVVLMESDSIRKLFSNECTPVVNFSPAHEIGPSEGLRLCEKLETSLASLYQQRLDRESIFVNIMKTVATDNICDSILSNPQNEEKIMEQELQKYKVFDTSLQANIVTQSQIQVEIKGIVENIKTNSTHYRYFCISREKYNDLTKSWKSLASELEEVHIRLEKAEAGLIQLNSTIVPLETSILDFVEGRKVASGELIQRLHGYTMHSSLSPQTLNLVPPRETQLSYATSQLDIGSQAPASYFPQSSPYQGHYTNNLGIMNQTAPASQFAALRPPVPLQSPS